jgi:ribonuclease BN (tRNA processing enzyme)
MKLTVVGSSPAWPNPGSAHAGYLVEGPGRLLLDCGPGVLGRLREHEAWPRVDAIAITHFHLDHFGDLVPWALASRYGPGAETPAPALFLPPGGIAVLRETAELFGTPETFANAFVISEYVEGATFRAAGFDVTPTRVPHYTIEAYGFRVTDGVAVLAYSGDSGPSDALIEIARDADLFICDGTLDGAEPEPRGHLSVAEAAAVFDVSRARRLLLTHRPSELTVSDGIEVAYDGLVLDVSGTPEPAVELVPGLER